SKSSPLAPHDAPPMSSTPAPTDAGDYQASATFAGDANHSGSSDSATYTIFQATTTTTVLVSDATYDGSPHGGTASWLSDEADAAADPLTLYHQSLLRP